MGWFMCGGGGGGESVGGLNQVGGVGWCMWGGGLIQVVG